MKHILLPVLLFTLSTAIGQTKSARVAAYLGTLRFETEAAPAGVVKFAFEKATLKRKADGQTSYASLLKADAYFTDDDNAGALKVITLMQGGKEILIGARPSKMTPASDDPARPRVLTGDMGQGSIRHKIFPDSATAAETMNNAKRDAAGWWNEFLVSSGPIWDFCKFLFNIILFPILAAVGGFFRYIAKTSASESAQSRYGVPKIGPFMYRCHQWASSSLIVITWIVGLFILMDVFFIIMAEHWSLWLMLPAWAGALRLAEILTAWIVPNMPIIGNKKAPAVATTTAAQLNP